MDFKGYNIKRVHQNQKNAFDTDKNKKKYKTILADAWFKDGYNIALLTGAVNNLIMVDLDIDKKPWNDYDKHPFIQKFGKEYINKFNTLTVRSQSGVGFHLYFQYDKRIKQGSNHDLAIDTRSNGGYGMFPGSSINDRKYTICNDTTPKPIPVELIEYLFEIGFDQNNLSKRKNIQYKNKTSINKLDYEIFNHIKKYPLFDIDKHINMILDKLSMTFFDSTKTQESWIRFKNFTAAMKLMNQQIKWKAFCKQRPGFNEIENQKIWDTITFNEYDPIEWLIRETKEDKDDVYDELILGYYKLKHVLKNKRYADRTIDTKYINDKVRIQDIKQKGIVIKSDTGTGKTTLIKEYLKDERQTFIIPTSRVSLAQELYNTMGKHGINVQYYENSGYIHEGESLIITIESLVDRTEHIDFKDYVLVMDEYNSLINHLITSPTIKSRRDTFTTLKNIIKRCKKVICIDADITDTCLMYLDICELEYLFIDNTKKSNNGVKCTELKSRKSLIHHVKQYEKWLISTDSAREAEAFYKELSNFYKNIKLITAEEDNYINFDLHDCIIYSPKVIYGIDSIMDRPVFSYYKAHTINPKAMLQQIARCRNITHLYYVFTKKTYNDEVSTYNSIKADLIITNQYSTLTFTNLESTELANQYIDLCTRIKYDELAYNTNKFAHFKLLLNQRGFIETHDNILNIEKEDNNITDINEEVIEEKIENIVELVSKKNKYIKMNDILGIPDRHLTEYHEMFLEYGKLEKHLNFVDYLNKTPEQLYLKLNDSGEFSINKFKSKKNRLIFLDKFEKKLQLKKDFCLMIDTPGGMGFNEDENKEYNKTYKIIFNMTKNNKLIDFNDSYECQKILVNIYKDLFGNDIIGGKRVMKDKKRFTEYQINTDFIDYNNRVHEFWKEDPLVEFWEEDGVKYKKCRNDQYIGNIEFDDTDNDYVLNWKII